MVSAPYLRTDEREDLLSSLKLIRVSAQECRDDVQSWKWIVVGAHSSLQAAIVFHLSFGNDLIVAKPAHAKKWLAAHRGSGNYPDMHMDFFLELYRKAKSEQILGFRLVTEESQDQSVERLLELRNEFVHFMPKGWSIELAMLPGICLDSLAVIGALAQGPLGSRWEDDPQPEHLESVPGECRALLQQLQVTYDAA
jgi:hypothetical protein